MSRKLHRKVILIALGLRTFKHVDVCVTSEWIFP